VVEFQPQSGYHQGMIARNIMPRLMTALTDTPVVVLHGARQVGKSTLARMAIEAGHPARYLSLDDPGVFAAAQADPVGFVRGLEGPVVIDEWQRVPELARAIKMEVDEQRIPGRFLLTGSASALALPRISEFLAGRMEIITLWPFSQGEIVGVHDNLVDALFEGRSLASRRVGTDDGESSPSLLGRLARGGYPEAVARANSSRRAAWFSSYVTSVLQRDVRDLANIERLADMPRLLGLLAARSASLLSFTELASSVSMPQTTLKRYMSILQSIFLVQLLPAWSRSRSKRLVKAPKVLLSDVGLATHLAGVDGSRLLDERKLLGSLVEDFVIMEAIKQLGWSETDARPLHFRDHGGNEVDMVLERRDGRIVGLEVKAGVTVGSSDFRGLRKLAEVAGSDFIRGILLYGGKETIPFGDGLQAVPLGRLWADMVLGREL
jgi:predicted AAA+ superfamily ATPase